MFPPGLQIFGTSLYRSRNELLQLGVFLSIAVILFASAIYHAEYRNHSEMYVDSNKGQRPRATGHRPRAPPSAPPAPPWHS